jgi:hypothetical protein
MATNQLEVILDQVQRLSPNEQLTLIQRIAEFLLISKPQQRGPGLVYGKYRGTPDQMSTEEDFRLAEWHPTEEQLNGA